MTTTIASLDNHADISVMEGAHKDRILDEYDALPAGGEQRGALLRREGLHRSQIAEWRKARDPRARKGLKAKSKPKRTAEQVELDKLRRLDNQLQADLKRTRLALQITGEARALLEILWACHAMSASPDCANIGPSWGEQKECDEDHAVVAQRRGRPHALLSWLESGMGCPPPV